MTLQQVHEGEPEPHETRTYAFSNNVYPITYLPPKTKAWIVASLQQFVCVCVCVRAYVQGDLTVSSNSIIIRRSNNSSTSCHSVMRSVIVPRILSQIIVSGCPDFSYTIIIHEWGVVTSFYEELSYPHYQLTMVLLCSRALHILISSHLVPVQGVLWHSHGPDQRGSSVIGSSKNTLCPTVNSVLGSSSSVLHQICFVHLSKFLLKLTNHQGQGMLRLGKKIFVIECWVVRYAKRSNWRWSSS